VTVSQKASLSLLISVFLFAIFTVVSFAGLFDLVETRFYNPSITKNVSRVLEQETRVIQDFIVELDEQFAAALQNEAVKRSFLPNQSAEDIFERSKLFGTLMESFGGLQSVRFIDAAGRRIHYSTLQSDVFYQDRLSISYRNYDEETEPFLYRDISVSNEENTKLTLDSQQDRILFSLPFYDSYNIYQGTALFSLSVRAVSDRLLTEGLIKYGEDVSVISHPGGIVIGMPRTGKDSLNKESLMNAIAVVWNEGITSLTPLDSGNGEVSFALISAKTAQGLFTGKIVDEALFAFPFAMKIILLASFFLTTYLIIFLLFNVQQDSMTVIQNRLKRLQINLFEEYYERKGDMDWARWSKELEYRREEVRGEIKRGIKIKSRHNVDIDTLIDKSWNEMAAVMNAQGQPQITANIDEDKLSSILNRVLAAAGNLPPAASPSAIPQTNIPAAKSETLEEISEVEELEDLEELSEVEEFDSAEELEELSDAEEIEPIGEDDEIEELEELEELDDSEELSSDETEESLEILEEIESVDEDEILEEIEPIDEVEELESFDEAESIAELEELDDGDTSETGENPLEESNPSDESSALLKQLEGIITFSDSEDSEELEEIEEELSVETRKPLSEEDVSRLASEIEFSDDEPDEPHEEIDHSFEIFSPFDNILVDDESAGSPNDDSSRLEEINASYDMSLVYKPFQAEDSENLTELEEVFEEDTEQTEEVEVLEELPEEIEKPSNEAVLDDVIIEERDGVNYIADFNVNANAKNIDAGFKDLVDSVLKKTED
jgi:hypothetical protein